MKRYYKLYSYNSCLKQINYIEKATFLEVLFDTLWKTTRTKLKYGLLNVDVDYCGCQVYIPKQLGSYTAIIRGTLPKSILQKELDNCWLIK